MSATGSNVEITIDVIDANSSEAVGNITKQFQVMGTTGKEAGDFASQGLSAVVTHANSAKTAVLNASAAFKEFTATANGGFAGQSTSSQWVGLDSLKGKFAGISTDANAAGQAAATALDKVGGHALTSL